MKKANNQTLTAKEIEILRWVQEGKTNGEIGMILGKSGDTVKYHLKSIQKKLNVTNRAHAISSAIGMGLLPPVFTQEDTNALKKLKVGIVGLGKGGRILLNIFKERPWMEVLWAADRDPTAEGLIIAREMGIPTGVDYKKFVDEKVDVVINLTGSMEVSEELRRLIPPDTELMGGLSAKIMWQLFEERRKRFEERERALKEHEALYHLGLVIESINSLKDAGAAIIDYATKLTNTPAGSIALFDEKKEDMVLVASKGFSSSFKKQDRWDIRKGGLTSKILNHEGPFFVHDIREIEGVNPSLLKEGIRTLLAAPLMVEGRIVGVLYVNDFKRRKFRAEDVSLFSLLTIYAGLTIDRVRAIEETRLLSITDGLTGLYNQRYIMEQMQRELQRGARHDNPVTVIMFDIDDFKGYNDEFGHLEGNKVLKGVARIIKKTARVTDTVGRFGGEEFCVIMPNIKRDGAVSFSERVLKEIEGSKTLPNRIVTISGGIAVYPQDGKTHLKLLKKADERLYRAKKDGRNRVCATDRG